MEIWENIYLFPVALTQFYEIQTLHNRKTMNMVNLAQYQIKTCIPEALTIKDKFIISLDLPK